MIFKFSPVKDRQPRQEVATIKKTRNKDKRQELVFGIIIYKVGLVCQYFLACLPRYSGACLFNILRFSLADWYSGLICSAFSRQAVALRISPRRARQVAREL